MKILPTILIITIILGLGYIYYDFSIDAKPNINNNINNTDNTSLPKQEANINNVYKKNMSNNTVEGLKIEDLVIGDGKEAVLGKIVSVNYVGTLLDGKKFDSSYDRNQSFEFALGGGQVIKGWDLGVVGMKVGGKRKLTIAPELAYGEREIPGAIPANSTLVFEVELLNVK